MDAHRSSQPTQLQQNSTLEKTNYLHDDDDDDADADAAAADDDFTSTNDQTDVSSLQIPHISDNKDSRTCQSLDLISSDLSEVPVKFELRRDDLERLKNHLQGSHQEALATVIAHAAQIKSPGFRVPSSSTILSEALSSSHTVKVPIDSYSWRKYGMKQVKSPEGSRSYYKCTYSACDAKKIESCDRFSSIIKIVYKNQHKHDPPKRVISKKCDMSSTPKSLKRKSISTPPVINCSVLKSPKKPKFIVHAAADVEISADGYRWKKYGQKMVKGSPHPRNYYKCTSAGCTVRKHIEKVDDGSSEVTITYKGVHDHDMPVPKKGQGPPTTFTITTASKNIIQYKRREHLSTQVSNNEAARRNESGRTRTLLSVGFEIKRR